MIAKCQKLALTQRPSQMIEIDKTHHNHLTELNVRL